MSEQQDKLEITPWVVDLGHRIIQLQHVVSIGNHALHPFRPLGVLLLLGGLGLIGSELIMRGAVAFELQSRGSLPLWLGFGAAGIGLFLLLYARRVLLIRTSDGGRVELPASSDEAATALMLRVRNAMEAGSSHGSGHAPQGYPPTQGSADVAGPRTGFPAAMSYQSSASGRSHLASETGSMQTGPAGRRIDGHANGHVGRGAFGGAAAPEGIPAGEPETVAYQRGGSSTASHAPMGGIARRQPGSEPLALPTTIPTGLPRDDGSQELAALMEHVRRSDVQHKDALLDLLRVVEDHYRGRASREDAIAHWRSFADYVVQYLGSVDGLIAHTERFGRHMLGR